MREIGRLFGVSSHVIGRKLKELGSRTREGKPSRAAFDGGFCDEPWPSVMSGYCWAWERTKTIAAPEESGLKRA